MASRKPICAAFEISDQVAYKSIQKYWNIYDNAEKYCKIIKILKIPKNESIKYLVIGNTELDKAD